MTERERWVVYPLLFLALGAALRDKLFDRTFTKSIVCQELTVLEEEPNGVRILAQIGRSDSMRSASNAYMIVNGQLDTELINAKQYAFRNVPFVPALQTIMAAPIDLLRALQQSTGGQPSSGRVVPLQPQSGADQTGTSGEELKAGDGRPEATEAPLADPPENR
jgi:hypothetical protein